MKKYTLHLLALISLVSLPFTKSMADEGMWLPSLIHERIADMQSKGLKISAEDLYSINNSSLKDGIVRFGRGCTGELISSKGLLITNHHCGFGQIQSHSSLEHDYLTNGFWAMNLNEELPNPGLTVSFLVRMEDVTEKVLKGYTEQMDEETRLGIIAENSKLIISEVEKEGIGYKADILPLFYGNNYYLFLYQVFSDVRLVGAPPSSIGKFGGDTDNWMWPRHTGDFSLFRIYADKDNNPAPYSPDNVPYTPKKFFEISTQGVNEGDFTFVYGFPGSTREYIISDEADFIANRSNPHKIALRTARLGIQKKYMESSPAIRIQYASKNASVANAWKKWQGESKGINKLGTVDSKRKLESAFSEWAAGKEEYSSVVESLKEKFSAMEEILFVNDYYMEAPLSVEALRFAVSYTKSAQKNRDNLRAEFFKDYCQQIDRECFVEVMSRFVENIDSLYHPKIFTKMMEESDGSIEKLAESLFEKSCFTCESRLIGATDQELADDPFVILGSAFMERFTDLLALVGKEKSQLDLLYRKYVKGLREFMPEKSFYPDANLTLRIAYGTVQGYKPADGITYLHRSTIDGILQKDNPDIYDYNIPQSLRDLCANKDYGRWEVDGTVPVAFIATNHTTGGNSGSPVIDAEGKLIGVNFDRVWEGTMSDIAFDPELCRNIALDIRYALFVIDRLAGASHLIDEMVID